MASWSNTLSAERVRQSLIGVMISLACFSFSDKTPLRMAIYLVRPSRGKEKDKQTSSSRRGSSPCLWNCRKDLSSAFL